LRLQALLADFFVAPQRGIALSVCIVEPVRVSIHAAAAKLKRTGGYDWRLACANRPRVATRTVAIIFTPTAAAE